MSNEIEFCTIDNKSDANGNPAGGMVDGVGLRIHWQEGPLGRGDERKEPCGAFVETVIAAAKSRLEFYQTSKFKCDDNHNAILALESAINILNKRTANREERGVEGTHQE